MSTPFFSYLLNIFRLYNPQKKEQIALTYGTAVLKYG